MADRPSLVLRPAVKTDARLLYEWRNDPEARKNSRQADFVSWESHEAWLARALSSPERIIRIVEEQGRPVGMVRADQCARGWELSWTVAPAVRGRGIGRRMMKQFVATLAKPLVAVIRTGNVPSIKIASAAGLLRVGTADQPGFELWALD